MEPLNLRRLRQEAILSQEELAARSGVARDTISKLETGKRKAHPGTLRKLAEVLEVRPQMLLGGVVYFDDGTDEPGESGGEDTDSGDGKRGRIGF